MMSFTWVVNAISLKYIRVPRLTGYSYNYINSEISPDQGTAKRLIYKGYIEFMKNISAYPCSYTSKPTIVGSGNNT